MIWRALACDYDGTLATQDRIGPGALAALEAARRAGVRLILVTGRTFFELIRVCERLDLFDAVVAENGGVLYFPAKGVLRDQGPAPRSRLLVELDQRGISYQVGRVIVGVLRDEESRVRDALDAVGGGLEIVYNRGSLMLLPPGVSKGTGVRQAIQALGVSFHDVLGVGDAENDLDLFEACGWTACPDNGVQELKDRADWVFPGENGTAVANAIVGPILGDRLSLARSRRHRVAIGWSTDTAEAVTVPERGINVLVQGDTLSGKSWLAGALVERLAARQYSVCVIDPEGDYRVLAALPSVGWAAVTDEVGWRDALARMDHDPSACVVLDLSTLEHAERSALIAAGLTLIRDRRRRWGPPHWVVLDEAHYWLGHEGVPDEAVGLDDKGFCLVSYRASALRDAVWNATDVFLCGRTTSATELLCLRTRFQGSPLRDVASILPSLPRGEFLSLETDDEWKALTFVAAPRTTWHVRHFRKYADGRLPEHRCFFLRRPDGRLVATVGSLGEFLESLESVDEEVLAFHAARGDFSRWLLEVFADQELGARLAKIERRWCRHEIQDLRTALRRSVADTINRTQQRREGDHRGR
jgi:hydroxymethylpyrimidine pyrophosphatase-like HAD family hydrolase